ncbi:unnamed protein product [Prunus armeniaca]|uniref:Uncharacterized protein n=1 Tax=Prunus armeniaca TaxID=36596 RepID=A0A6J5TII9_PRUAR|nr:unnamed protein product [Prunus armeniaca]
MSPKSDMHSFDVGQPLMRGTFVVFPGEHHEEYGSSGVRSEALLAFVGLAVEDDLRGRKLKGSM